ncbi:MAG: hypothetical protein MUO84_07455 [Thermoplasmata archaeon]|nr:hypothetical protein [Thermoplasmata archaeon]
MMVETEGADFQRKAIFSFYSLLLVAGIALYWIWGIMYDTWYPFDKGNIGIYVIYAPLMLFGIVGLLLYRKKKHLPQ